MKRVFLAKFLIAAGLLQTALPVLAQVTSAGTQITNQATAEFNYVNNLGVNVLNNATSNTVSVEVAEVAGITVSSQGVTDTSGGTVAPGDSLIYRFQVTNLGNDATRFFLPGQAVVSGSATLTTITADLNGDGTFETTIPSTGLVTNVIGVGEAIDVNVTVQVAPTAATGDSISVQFGNTAPNDNTAATQNQPDAPDSAGVDEVRTVDAANGAPGETDGSPLNGEREASAVQTATVAAKPQAFATLLNVRSNYDDNGTANAINDDEITYELSLDVETSAPAGSSGLNPANLVGTPISLLGQILPVDRVLISAAIPEQTSLASVATPPAGWTTVYTTVPTTVSADDATWTTIVPVNLALVTRIGFIYDGTLATGTSTTGFSYTVETDGVLTSSASINNIAQVFGETEGDPTNSLVYDESGDQNPSNFNDDGSVGSNTPTTGIANPAIQGEDTNNDNTGTGTGGEVNVLTLVGQSQILNGPNLSASAVGPTDNNDDFTNQVAFVPSNTPPGATTNPLPVAFTNTLRNPNTSLLTDVRVEPIPAANLPVGTEVLIADLNGGLAAYRWNGSDFDALNTLGELAADLDSALLTSLDPLLGGLLGNILGALTPLPGVGFTLGAGLPINYSVIVNLPAGTALSTDTGAGYPVTLRAYADTNNNDAFDAGETYNDTIDRVYNGVLRLVKESRILPGSGPAVSPADSVFSTAAKNPAPGNIIEYRITYTNISAPEQGSGNSTLNLTGIIITDDGTSANSNWGKDNNGDGVIDTSNVVGSATDSSGGLGSIIAYFSGSLGATVSTDIAGLTVDLDVTRYVDTVLEPLVPGESRTFTFQRRLN
ncbi:beta strand repeat-containing protein [Almyronema epifaneia]|uniref:Beta strand repeat-containing protein n=1 Tax=Almyronema epifaneia S1 TaxID=2991925 RepID=A0ABW6IJH1_9CYAN